jgi:hypothetical protein
MIQAEKTPMKRLWPFIVLNVIVSAVTVTAVLLIWSALHPCNVTPGMLASSRATPKATLPPKGEELFKIDNVYGAGDLKTEHIHFIYTGSEPLNLENWQIKLHSQNFHFPAFIIYKGGAFDLYSGSGVNTTIELYMGEQAALWQSGSTITLLDPDGGTRLTYRVP